MQVYKFGGSSIRNAEGIRTLRRIVADVDSSLVLVVSALGKTTNALEDIVRDRMGDGNAWPRRLESLRGFHEAVVSDLLPDPGAFLGDVLRPSFDGLALRLEAPPGGSFDFLYDQVVSMGEVWSTLVVHRYLAATGLDIRFMDIREYLITDDCFREGRVDWEQSRALIRKGFICNGKEHYITQGFIAGTGKGHATTLGREGSDYTAAILAHILDARLVTVWKDVRGVMNADPEDFPHPERLPEISYREAVELSFFGAKVLHPKTIKPLYEKKIPLRVKSYTDPSGEGTLIHDIKRMPEPLPVYVRKRDQVLISILPRDLSFVIDEGLGRIFSLIDDHGVKVNLIQNSAVTLSLCVDRFDGRVERLIDELSRDFRVRYNAGVELLTIRHYTEESVREMIAGKTVLIEQKTRSTASYVTRNPGDPPEGTDTGTALRNPPGPSRMPTELPPM
ncbi:MAG: aspartate kinase [Deltaproteobacteria bacterium]|nr:aspartate kinase [Deltaproteobacteria bacterium]